MVQTFVMTIYNDLFVSFWSFPISALLAISPPHHLPPNALRLRSFWFQSLVHTQRAFRSMGREGCPSRHAVSPHSHTLSLVNSANLLNSQLYYFLLHSILHLICVYFIPGCKCFALMCIHTAALCLVSTRGQRRSSDQNHTVGFQQELTTECIWVPLFLHHPSFWLQRPLQTDSVGISRRGFS